MKISKVTITITSTLASVILLTGCGTNSANSQTTQSSTSDNQVTMTYDQLRSRENTMSTLWYQKQLRPRHSIYKVTMSLLIV